LRRWEGKNFKGRVLGVVVGTVGKHNLEKAFRNSVKAIEVQSNRPRPTDEGPLNTGGEDAEGWSPAG
jgi:hypothetical protein